MLSGRALRQKLKARASAVVSALPVLIFGALVSYQYLSNLLLSDQVEHHFAVKESFTGARTEHLSVERGGSVSKSDFWGVITTILEVSSAVKQLVADYNISLVVVGDKLTDHAEWRRFERSHDCVVYLSPSDQVSLNFSVVKHIPWNHFGRKSIGFLFAMQSGAQRIYDFDDDNHVIVNSFDALDAFKINTVQTDKHVFNPYPLFEPTTLTPRGESGTFTWPRGFSLQYITDEDTYNVSMQETNVKLVNVAVLQSLANHNPDVDAIFRMTRALPVNFSRKRQILIVPKGVHVPWNAQAVLIQPPAFFGLLLPVTVTGRVSDIWRSYLTNRLLWETDYEVGFASPYVKQYRNPHSYMKDFEDEGDLYLKADELLSALSRWTSDGHEFLETAYLDLINILVNSNILRADDLKLAAAWCKDLKALSYTWPSISSRMMPRELPKRPVVDERKLDQQDLDSHGRNALCLIGRKGGIQKLGNLKTRVLNRMHADLFLVSPDATSYQDDTYSSINANGVDLLDFFDEKAPDWRSTKKIGNYLGGLPRFTQGHGAYQLRDRWFCNELILEAEKQQGFDFEYVGIGRLDMLWMEDHPAVKPEGCWIPCQQNDMHGICDQWAWCNRSFAGLYMTEPMNSIIAFGNSEDAEYQALNTESHLAYTLKQQDIPIQRGKAHFLRVCEKSSGNCKKIEGTDIHVKSSGEQLEAVIKVASASLIQTALRL